MPLKSFGKISETWYIFNTARNNIMKFLSSKINTFDVWLWNFFLFFGREAGRGDRAQFSTKSCKLQSQKSLFSLCLSCVTCFSHRSVLLEIVVARFVRNILWGVAPPACTLACYKGWGQGLPVATSLWVLGNIHISWQPLMQDLNPLNLCHGSLSFDPKIALKLRMLWISLVEEGNNQTWLARF